MARIINIRLTASSTDEGGRRRTVTVTAKAEAGGAVTGKEDARNGKGE